MADSHLAELATDLLATHRLVRLATADVLTLPARDRVVRWAYARADPNRDPGIEPASGWADYAEVDPDAPRLATLVTCRWCAGVWIAAGVVALRALCPTPWGYVARALAASSAAALLAAPED